MQIVLTGAGKNFCTGIDLASLMGELGPGGPGPVGGAGPRQQSTSSSSGGGGDGEACQGRQRYRFRRGGARERGSGWRRCSQPMPDRTSLPRRRRRPLTDPLLPPAAPAPRACRQFVFVLQEAMSAFEACPVPVIAAVHGHCVGAGIDMVTACDIRLATESAVFSVKVRRGGAGLKSCARLHALAWPPRAAARRSAGAVRLQQFSLPPYPRPCL